MDRFIECMCSVSVLPFYYLKSNMDRFIDMANSQENCYGNYLKSNMDRFIVNICLNS